MPQAQPKKVAQPRPPAPAASTRLLGTNVFSTKKQEEFNAEADALAAALGWSGPDANELNDITVGDAKRYLRKTFHEVHQAALTPERDTPEASVVCEHLAVTDPEEVKIVGEAITAAYEREAKDAPANPTNVGANPKVGAMAANIDVFGSMSAGKK